MSERSAHGLINPLIDFTDQVEGQRVVVHACKTLTALQLMGITVTPDTVTPVVIKVAGRNRFGVQFARPTELTPDEQALVRQYGWIVYESFDNLILIPQKMA